MRFGVLLATLFAIGLKMAVQDGLDYRNGLIVGVAFWIGAGRWWRDMTVSRGR